MSNYWMDMRVSQGMHTGTHAEEWDTEDMWPNFVSFLQQRAGAGVNVVAAVSNHC